MSKKLSWVVIDLDCADPQLVPTHGGTFVRATLTWDGEDTADVWFENAASDLYIHQDRKLLVVERNGTMQYGGYEYLDTVVSGIGTVYHIYQDVVQTPSEIEKLWPTLGLNYRITVALDHPRNIVSKTEATTAGAKAFLSAYSGFREEIVHGILTRLRKGLEREELTSTQDDLMLYISVERIDDK